MLYFAYGSNMNLAQMRRRCPGAHFCGRGVLHDYRLVERCFADIEEATGASVHGAVFEITSPDLRALDHNEGSGYIRKFGTVDLGTARIPMLVYQMTGPYRKRLTGMPYSPLYRKICRQGAAACRLPVNEFDEVTGNADSTCIQKGQNHA